jgi:hypothetical protein
MTDKEKLHIYDQLREAHRFISVLSTEGWDDEHVCAIEAVDNVLYLAEEHFARMSQ